MVELGGNMPKECPCSKLQLCAWWPWSCPWGQDRHVVRALKPSPTQPCTLQPLRCHMAIKNKQGKKGKEAFAWRGVGPYLGGPAGDIPLPALGYNRKALRYICLEQCPRQGVYTSFVKSWCIARAARTLQERSVSPSQRRCSEDSSASSEMVYQITCPMRYFLSTSSPAQINCSPTPASTLTMSEPDGMHTFFQP